VSDALLVGVDAGGSSIAVAVARDSGIVGTATSSGANPVTAGVEAAADTIAATILAAVGNAASPIAVLYVGAAGAGRASTADGVAHRLRERFPRVRTVCVEGDERIALRASVETGAGVVLMAGTGSAAYAENGERRVRVGGYGYLLGDEGSGFAVGMAAVKRLARVYDGRLRMDETACFAQQLLGVNSRDALIDTVYEKARNGNLDVAAIASLASDVIAAAARGIASSLQIVQGAADELARLGADTARIAELTAPRVAFAGGLLREPNTFAQALRAALHLRLPDATVVARRVEPHHAALQLAKRIFAEAPA